MDFKYKYKEELDKLLENEDNFEYFNQLIKKLRKYDTEATKEIIDELLLFAIDHNLNNTIAWIYYYLGWYFMDTSKYNKSVEAFLISNDVFEDTGDEKGLMYACNGLTNVYCQIGQFKLANEWGLKGISLCEDMNDKEALCTLLINTGINYIQMKDYIKAKDILKNIKMINYELNNSQKISYFIALAEVEINIGEPNKALIYLDEAAKLDDSLNMSTDTSEIFKLKGMAYAKLYEYDLAEKEFIKCYDFSNQQGYIYEKCSSLIEWAKLCVKICRYDNAIQTLEYVSETSKTNDFNVLMKESYHLLYEIFKKLKNEKEALYYLEKYIEIDDLIYDYEQNQLMAKMNIKHTKREAKLYKLLYDRTELLSSIGQKIISNLNINSIIDLINEELNNLIKADLMGIALYDCEKGDAAYNYILVNSKNKSTSQFNVNDKHAFGAYCIRNKKDIIINDVTKEYKKYTNLNPDDFNKGIFEKSMIYTPLIIKEKVVGIITVQSYKVNAYDKDDLNILKIIANYAAIAIDNAMSYKKLEHIATFDNMTGFLTRFEITRLGQILYEKFKEKSFSIIMIDIDDFKSINDTYGHIYGDKALNMVSAAISDYVRSSDYIGRYGGDEFLLICPGATKSKAIDIAERIRKEIYNKIFILEDDISVKITLSLGVYQYGENDTSFIDGVKKADKYLYMSKEGTKNKVSCDI